jgi:hypothetical protein
MKSTIAVPPCLVLPLGKPKSPLVITQDWPIAPAAVGHVSERPAYGAIHILQERTVEVFSPGDGLLACSYHSCTVRGPEKEHGKGLGTFALLQCDDPKLWIILGRLDRVDGFLPFIKPDLQPTGDYFPTDLLNPEIFRLKARHVTKGTLIGNVGTSGCTWGYSEIPAANPRSPRELRSWCLPHLLIDVRTTQGIEYSERSYGDHIDPFGLSWGTLAPWPNPLTDPAIGLFNADPTTSQFQFAK